MSMSTMGQVEENEKKKRQEKSDKKHSRKTIAQQIFIINVYLVNAVSQGLKHARSVHGNDMFFFAFVQAKTMQ